MAMPFNSPLMIDQELWSVGHVLETQHTSFSRYKLKVTFQWLEIEASHLKTNLSGSFSLGLGQRSRIWAHNWRQAAWLGNAHGSHKHCLWNWWGSQLQRWLLGCWRSFWWGQTEQDKGKSHSFVLSRLVYQSIGQSLWRHCWYKYDVIVGIGITSLPVIAQSIGSQHWVHLQAKIAFQAKSSAWNSVLFFRPEFSSCYFGPEF